MFVYKGTFCYFYSPPVIVSTFFSATTALFGTFNLLCVALFVNYSSVSCPNGNTFHPLPKALYPFSCSTSINYFHIVAFKVLTYLAINHLFIHQCQVAWCGFTRWSFFYYLSEFYQPLPINKEASSIFPHLPNKKNTSAFIFLLSHLFFH